MPENGSADSIGRKSSTSRLAIQIKRFTSTVTFGSSTFSNISHIVSRRLSCSVTVAFSTTSPSSVLTGPVTKLHALNTVRERAKKPDRPKVHTAILNCLYFDMVRRVCIAQKPWRVIKLILLLVTEQRLRSNTLDPSNFYRPSRAVLHLCITAQARLTVRASFRCNLIDSRR